MRDLREAIKAGNAKARLAVDKFTWTIARWIGSYVAELNGLDMLVFTGGIGENDIASRARDLRRAGRAGHRARSGAQQRARRGGNLRGEFAGYGARDSAARGPDDRESRGAVARRIRVIGCCLFAQRIVQGDGGDARLFYTDGFASESSMTIAAVSRANASSSLARSAPVCLGRARLLHRGHPVGRSWCAPPAPEPAAATIGRSATERSFSTRARADTMIEFTHRITSGLSFFSVVALLWWTFARTAARPSGPCNGGGCRGVSRSLRPHLGAFLVKLGLTAQSQSPLRAPYLALHLTNTLLLLAALTLTAHMLSRRNGYSARQGSPGRAIRSHCVDLSWC